MYFPSLLVAICSLLFRILSIQVNNFQQTIDIDITTSSTLDKHCKLKQLVDLINASSKVPLSVTMATFALGNVLLVYNVFVHKGEFFSLVYFICMSLWLLAILVRAGEVYEGFRSVVRKVAQWPATDKRLPLVSPERTNLVLFLKEDIPAIELVWLYDSLKIRPSLITKDIIGTLIGGLTFLWGEVRQWDS